MFADAPRGKERMHVSKGPHPYLNIGLVVFEKLDRLKTVSIRINPITRTITIVALGIYLSHVYKNKARTDPSVRINMPDIKYLPKGYYYPVPDQPGTYKYREEEHGRV